MRVSVSQVQDGYFSLVTNPTVSIKYFSEDQIQKADVQFTQDGSSRSEVKMAAVSVQP